MPRAAHGVADDEPIHEGRAIVGAGRADRVHLLTAAHEQHGFAPRVPHQRGAVRDVAVGDALAQILS